LQQDLRSADKDGDGKLSQSEVALYLHRSGLPAETKQLVASLHGARIPTTVDSKAATLHPPAHPIEEVVQVILQEAVQNGRVPRLTDDVRWYQHGQFAFTNMLAVVQARAFHADFRNGTRGQEQESRCWTVDPAVSRFCQFLLGVRQTHHC
jgi:hypothetical protein